MKASFSFSLAVISGWVANDKSTSIHKSALLKQYSNAVVLKVCSLLAIVFKSMDIRLKMIWNAHRFRLCYALKCVELRCPLIISRSILMFHALHLSLITPN